MVSSDQKRLWSTRFTNAGLPLPLALPYDWEEGYRDHWGHTPRSDADFVAWTQSRWFRPDLWKVSWDGNAVASMVLNYIDGRRNAWVGVERGSTQDIFVLHPWRRRGLARSLLTESVRMFTAMGMYETLLGVDSKNPCGAHVLYQSIGYQPYRKHGVSQASQGLRFRTARQ